MFKNTMRRGLLNRLLGASVPYGLATLLAEANYPGGEDADMAREWVVATPKQAQQSTRNWLEHRHGTLEQLANDVFGHNAADVATYVQQVEAGAQFINRLR